MTDIVTLTMNPALDLATEVERLEAAHKMRCDHPIWHPGGGGINVARVLHRLGLDVMAMFPVGGSTGQRVCRLLAQEGVRSLCLPIEKETRESFHVTERASGREYRFVLPGPTLSESDWRQVLDRLQGLQPRPGCLVASGSLPPGVPDDFLGQLVRWAREAGVQVALDSSGEPLRLALAKGVWLVKPSLRELQELTGLPLDGLSQQVAAARELVTRGQAQLVALSLGGDGAVLVSAEGAWQAPSLKVQVAGTVGAGDSFLAGMLASLRRGEAPALALRHAMAAAASALTTAGTTLSQPEQIEALQQQVQVRAL